MKRVLTAVLLAPFIAWVILAGPQPVFLAVLSAVAILCFHEYSGIAAAYGIERPGPTAYAAGLVVLLAYREPWLAITLVALLMLAFTLGLDDLAKSLPRAAAAVFGIIYIFGTWRCAIYLRARNEHWLLFALALNWAGDTAAYYVGRAIGRHKLAPRVSPGKSWEGAVASLVAATGFAYACLHYFIPAVPPAHALLFGAAGNIAGQIGDLAESALKRGARVKDSGNMLPGHGGWLDRVDSALFALPVLYGLLLYLYP